MKQTKLYQLNEASERGFMMSYVIITQNDNVIIIDGGRPENMELLKKVVGGRHISAWILTHAHSDHISGFIEEMEQNGGADFDFDTVYYHFPPYDLVEKKDVLNYEYFLSELNETLPQFLKVLPLFEDRTHIVVQGETLTIDEVKIEFLYSFHDGLYNNLMNDSSLVFKVTGPEKSVLFLGDLGPDGGDVLFNESRHLLKSDIVQMAHHGHMNCSMEVYAAIMPQICLWSAQEWLYNEPEVPSYLEDREELWKNGRIRMYGTAITRKWMELLGVKEHYVTKDGCHELII